MDDQTNKIPSRRKFLFLGFSTVALFSVFKFVIPHKKKKTVKMLTQEGRLVEIDQDLIGNKKKRITDSELQSWVKNKSVQH